MSTRAQGERIRIQHAIVRMRAILSSIEKTLLIDAPPSPDVGQAIAHSGSDLACSIARLEAYMRAETEPAKAEAAKVEQRLVNEIVEYLRACGQSEELSQWVDAAERLRFVFSSPAAGKQGEGR